MSVQNLEPNLDIPVALYGEPIARHLDLTIDESHAANAHLILLIATDIDCRDVLAKAVVMTCAERHGTASNA